MSFVHHLFPTLCVAKSQSLLHDNVKHNNARARVHDLIIVENNIKADVVKCTE